MIILSNLNLFYGLGFFGRDPKADITVLFVPVALVVRVGG